MIFVDTSAFYALMDRDDREHLRAAELWADLLKSSEILFTTNYVLVEICALAQHRLGLEAVRAIHEDVFPAIEVHWVGEDMHGLAIAALMAVRRRKLSLVDCTSFAAMRRVGIRKAFAFDQHFIEEGFETV